MKQTTGDLYELDCPYCGKPGLDDLWDCLRDGVYTTRATCKSCGKESLLEIEYTADVTATTIEKEAKP